MSQGFLQKKKERIGMLMYRPRAALCEQNGVSILVQGLRMYLLIVEQRRLLCGNQFSAAFCDMQ